MTFKTVAKTAEKFVADNSPAILTGIGVAGVIATAVLTGKATVKATDIVREYEHHIEEGRRANLLDDLTVTEKVGLTWKFYIPPTLAATTTVAAIICANQIGTRRAAAVAAAYSLSEKAFIEYKDKVAEKLGVKPEQSVRDELAQERVDRNPPKDADVVIVGDGDVLCYDTLTDRYFQSTMESIRGAQNSINEIVLNHMYASLGDFYSIIGLKATPYSEEVGWNVDHTLKINFSTAIADGGRPCIVMDYETSPIRGYNRLQ